MNNYIFTSWFSGNNGFPQHDHTEKCKPNDFSLIEKFHKSVNINKIPCIVFHNQLSKKFIKKYQTRYLKFTQREIKYRKSYNDERFFSYRDFIKEKNLECNNLFFTDCFDVIIHKNPFDLIRKEYDLYVGEDTKKGMVWIEEKMTKCNLSVKNFIKPFNAGIIGGEKEKIINFLEEYTNEMLKCPQEINSNMAVLNYILSKNKYKCFSGHPLHNKFKSFKHEGAYIQHK
jgi:UDP-glucuronate 4-epimerase